MGDDDAVDVGIASEGVDLITQAQPGVLGHVVAVDVAQLDGRQLGQMADRRYAADDLADIDASGLIICGLSGLAAAGDRAAGGDNDDVFFHRVCFLSVAALGICRFCRCCGRFCQYGFLLDLHRYNKGVRKPGPKESGETMTIESRCVKNHR